MRNYSQKYPQNHGNDANRDNYKKFNEGWCFLHENPKMVEFFHKFATATSWGHPRRMLAFFSPDDFRRGFCRWRYQVYAEVLSKRIFDKFKFTGLNNFDFLAFDYLHAGATDE